MKSSKLDVAPSRVSNTLKRLRSLCESGDPVFIHVKRLAEALGSARARHCISGHKIKPDFRTIVAAVLQAPSFNEVDALSDREFDEELNSQALTDRREQQTLSLETLFRSTLIGHGLPDDVVAHSASVIDIWQPTAQAPEFSVLRYNEIRLQSYSYLADMKLRMENVAHGHEELNSEDVATSCLLVRALTQSKLNSARKKNFDILKLDMGIVACRLGNSDLDSNREQALTMLETLFKQGEAFAGVHFARMRFEGWGTAHKGKDFGIANEVIDQIYLDSLSADQTIFQTRAGLWEMLDLRLRIKHDRILEGKSDPDLLGRRVKDLIETLVRCKRLGFDDKNLYLNMLLDPRETESDEIRDIIDANVDLKAYCSDLHQSL